MTVRLRSLTIIRALAQDSTLGSPSPRSVRSRRQSTASSIPRSSTPRRPNPARRGQGGYLAAYKYKVDMAMAQPVAQIPLVAPTMPGSGATPARRRQSTLQSPSSGTLVLVRCIGSDSVSPRVFLRQWCNRRRCQ